MTPNANPSGLGSIVRTIPVWQREHHRVTRAEDILSSTSVMQRMRRLRQMGLAYHAFPLAEHSRFIHSVGTAYWAMRMLDGLTARQQNLQRRNAALLAEMESRLGGDLSLELVVRTYALIHDVGLLPLGHTLKLQLRRFEEESRFSETFGLSVGRMAEECAELCASEVEARELSVYLALAEAAAHAPRLLRGEPLPDTLHFRTKLSQDALSKAIPVLCFVYDLVHGVYAADLLDWFVRDMTAMGVAADVPRLLVDSGTVVVAEPGSPAHPLAQTGLPSPIFRYGIDCEGSDGGGGIDALLQLAAMHRARLAVVLTGAYSDRKFAADAMLDKAFRILASRGDPSISSFGGLDALLRKGDDEFLTELQGRLSALGRANPIADLQLGRLPISVFQATGDEVDTLQGLARRDPYSAAGRDSIEKELASDLGCDPDDILVGASPRHMQGKEPTTLVRVAGLQWQPLSSIAASSGFASDMAVLAGQYSAGRRIMVLLHQRAIKEQPLLRGACERLFK
ncbi:MAG: hypothetical protein JNL14_14680 [Devosia sp.]|uniref:hypothetical protein n=1 Tax=Devosia sp. TaxID=1871048 RepID=UPI001A38D6FE|nr:hypothetical protein [Devosia sp.]MBL8598978.1 hypothetical protein [Devosia sp.]